jgi:hypothetical protein
MKKLIVLAMLVMAVAVWGQMGPDLTINAKIAYIGAWDQSGKTYSDKPMYELKFNWVVDDYNTAYLEFEEGPMSPGFSTGAMNYAAAAKPAMTSAAAGYNPDTFGALPDKAWWITDVGKALMLPVGVTFKMGLDEWNNIDHIKVTKSEWEDYLGERDFRTWGGQVEVSPGDVFTLRTQWAWNSNPKNFLVGAYGTVAPVTYEVTYFTNGMDFDKGWLEGGVEASQDVADGINVSAAVNAEYDLQDLGTLANPTWRVQAGAQAMYNSMASLGLAWRGQDQATAGGLQAQLWAAPIADKPLEIYLIGGIGLDDALYPDTFDSFEGSLKYSFGKAAYWVGYYYATTGAGNIAKEILDETVAGTATGDTNAIFIRGEIVF